MMKLRGFIFCSVILTVCATPPTIIDDISSADQCAVCSDFVDFIVTDEAESVPNNFIELLNYENFEETCIDGCKLTNDLKAEYEYDDDIVSTNAADLIQNLIKLPGCQTCLAILEITAKNSHGFDFSSIKYSLRHACEDIKGVIDTVKCSLFIKLRESKIIQAIYKFKKNSHQACAELKQC